MWACAFLHLCVELGTCCVRSSDLDDVYALERNVPPACFDKVSTSVKAHACACRQHCLKLCLGSQHLCLDRQHLYVHQMQDCLCMACPETHFQRYACTHAHTHMRASKQSQTCAHEHTRLNLCALACARQTLLAGVNGVMHFFGRLSFLVDENAHALHFFISALLQVRTACCYAWPVCACVYVCMCVCRVGVCLRACACVLPVMAHAASASRKRFCSPESERWLHA